MLSKPHITVLMASIFIVACHPVDAALDTKCAPSLYVMQAQDTRVSVTPDLTVMRDLSPTFIGFNLEWVDFQQDLWDAKRQQVRPEVLDWMHYFKGAVYRYPGGTGSNHLDWRDTVGELALRPKKQRVDWLPPISPQFGFDEYLSFVKQVNGTAWAVLNLYGDYEKEGEHAALAKSAADWVAYANQKASVGAPPILRWELGNELDRYRWSAEKYTRIMNQTTKVVLQQAPSTLFVSLLQDWPADKQLTVSEYDRHVMRGAQPSIQAFAHHLYYEELSWGSVEERMDFVCKSRQDAEASNISQVQFWITEHTKGLPGSEDVAQWKKSWVKTSDLEAAIVVAEAYIAATQVPEIQGLFLHSLGTAHGPWPMFNASKAGNLHPSVVYWAMRILRDNWLPTVLVSQVKSRNLEGSLGAHDVRAVVLTDKASQEYVVWAVNRFQHASPLTLSIPALAGAHRQANIHFISDTDKHANNISNSNQVTPQQVASPIRFDANGEVNVVLQPYSVSAIRITPFP